ncbi:MAG: L,D-transpeptidase [Actinobacteria bacterium]|nr:MAG: L,D-transpeptidase [Actinomycetota bacterium]
MMTTRSFAMYALAVLVLAMTFVPGASAVAPALPASYPAAGELVATRVAVRTGPDRSAKVIRLLQQFRTDYRLQIVLAVGQANGPDGTAWFKLNLPMRPNGTVGWIPAASATLRPTQSRIVVHRGLRRIELFRGGKRLLYAKVAVGAPGRETPLGEFYVTARFVPDDPFLGAFALETSAYSRLTEWPGGGKVGIHGTSEPWLLGQAVSHGCVRVSNRTALALEHLAPVGTPISIVAR